ncbi:MAG: hypothetical protein ACO3N7_11185 [Kiritimatiellia bacterium]
MTDFRQTIETRNRAPASRVTSTLVFGSAALRDNRKRGSVKDYLCGNLTLKKPSDSEEQLFEILVPMVQKAKMQDL